MQVVRGADSNINFAIRDPNGITVESMQWTNEGNIDTVLKLAGLANSFLVLSKKRQNEILVT